MAVQHAVGRDPPLVPLQVQRELRAARQRCARAQAVRQVLRVALNLIKNLACNINFTTPILELKNYMQH